MRHIRTESDRTSRRRRSVAIHLRFILIAVVFIGTVATAASFITSRARATAAQATSDDFWGDVKERRIKNRESRTTSPESYRTVRLKKQAFRQMIAGAPQEFTVPECSPPFFLNGPNLELRQAASQ